VFVGIGAGEIEGELVSEGFGQEIAAPGERFQVEELIFDQAMDGFDVALEGVSGGRDADVLAVAESGGEAGAVAFAIGHLSRRLCLTRCSAFPRIQQCRTACV